MYIDYLQIAAMYGYFDGGKDAINQLDLGKTLFFRQMYTVWQGKASLITHKIKRIAFGTTSHAYV